MSAYEWWKEHDRLWDSLVPRQGQALTVQGELIRCAGKLTDEAYRNGNINWRRGSGHEQMLEYIQTTLLSDATFGPERQASIRRDVDEVRRDHRNPNTGGHGTCYYNLSEAAVDWCMQHPELIPRESDPTLHR